MLAARVNFSIFFAYRDRSVKEVFAFSVPDDGHISRSRQLAVRGDFVAAHAFIAPLGQRDTFEPFTEIVLLDVEGNVHFNARFYSEERPSSSASQLHGRADGLFVHALADSGSELGVVVDRDDATLLEQRWIARSDPDDRGFQLGRLTETDALGTSELRFLDVASGLVLPSRYISEDDRRASSPAVVPGGMAYLLRSPSTLVFESAAGSWELPVEVALEPTGSASSTDFADGGWALFLLGGASAEAARYLAWKPSSGAWRELTLRPPAGMTLPSDDWNGPHIDHTGRIIMALEAPGTAQVFTTYDGAAWEPLGVPAAQNGYGTDITQAGGAVVFDGPWIAGAQLIGPQGGAGIELIRADGPGPNDNPLYFDDTLSPDGSCLAYFRSGTLRVIATGDYQQSDLGIHRARRAQRRRGSRCHDHEERRRCTTCSSVSERGAKPSAVAR